jgi:uncharacterized protein (TIGR00369 family)
MDIGDYVPRIASTKTPAVVGPTTAVFVILGGATWKRYPIMAEFEPRNPNFETVVRESFAKQTAMTAIDATLMTVNPGYIEIRLPYSPHLTQQHGFMHGGIITTIADSAAGYAAFSLVPDGFNVLSIEFKVNLLSPALGDYFVAQGEVIRPGRTIFVCKSDVYAYNGEDRKHVAILQASIMQVEVDENQ